MTTTLFQIENLVGLIVLRERGATVPALAESDKYTDLDLAKMLCVLAAGHLDQVMAKDGAS